MILIGQYDSPFVRRVGIALTLYGLAFEHEPWSSFGDADKLRAHNPLTRVPTLVLDDGTALVDSHAILDYLDGLVPAGQAMFPRAEPARHRALRIAALACGMADKAVSLFYETRLHKDASPLWTERCRTQVEATLGVLEGQAPMGEGYWFGERIGHADIAVVAALRFIGDAHPGLIQMAKYPRLAAFAARLERQPVFRRIEQPFVPPA